MVTGGKPDQPSTPHPSAFQPIASQTNTSPTNLQMLYIPEWILSMLKDMMEHGDKFMKSNIYQSRSISPASSHHLSSNHTITGHQSDEYEEPVQMDQDVILIQTERPITTNTQHLIYQQRNAADRPVYKTYQYFLHPDTFDLYAKFDNKFQ